MLPLSKSIKDDIKSQLLMGRSTRQIEKMLQVSHGLVVKQRAAIMKDDKENIPPPKVGRPAKVSKSTQHQLCSKFLVGNLQTLGEAQEFLQSLGEGPVHDRTIKRYLEANGIWAFIKPAAPALDKEHIDERLEFAKQHKNWTVEDWKNVMFSDEFTICRLGKFGRQYGYSNREHKLKHPHHFVPKMQAGGGKIQLWGCVTYNGVGDLRWIEGTMDSQFYIGVLRDCVIASRDYCGIDQAKFIFQQDNASFHSSKATKRYFKRAPYRTIHWPRRSPDLNLIERVWAFIKQKFYRYPTPPQNAQEMFDRVEEIWRNIPLDFLHELYEEMPKKIKCLIESKGVQCRVERGAGGRPRKQL